VPATREPHQGSHNSDQHEAVHLLITFHE
jgi:hypothetical protein